MKIDSNDSLIINGDNWQAIHNNETINGPVKLSLGQDTLIEDVHSYIDSYKDETFSLTEKRKDYKKNNNHIISYQAKSPIENKFTLKHTYKYQKNRLRITSDFNIPKNFKFKRHLGYGSLKLAGSWHKITITPPLSHLEHGGETYTILCKEQQKNTMIAHWHDSPLKIIFERKNGNRVEIGIGSDIWRWQQNFNKHPYSGSYKLFLHDDCILFQREILMTCTEFLQESSNQYRFSWYLAWDQGYKKPNLPPYELVNLFNEDSLTNFHDLKPKKLAYAVRVPCQELLWQNSQLKITSKEDLYRRENSSMEPCLMQSSVITNLKKIIRKILDSKIKIIIIEQLTDNICYQAKHFHKDNHHGLSHSNINALMDFSSWIQQQLKEDQYVYFKGAEQSPLWASLSC